jgi:hypothetical protein
MEMEHRKSRLLLEARLFKAQQHYQMVADNFAQVADMEREWAEWAESERMTALAIIHRYSELSCWAQAGYPHRSLHLVANLLDSDQLTSTQRSDLKQYQISLQYQFTNWMGEWASVSAPVVSSETSSQHLHLVYA